MGCPLLCLQVLFQIDCHLTLVISVQAGGLQSSNNVLGLLYAKAWKVRCNYALSLKPSYLHMHLNSCLPLIGPSQLLLSIFWNRRSHTPCKQIQPLVPEF